MFYSETFLSDNPLFIDIVMVNKYTYVSFTYFLFCGQKGIKF